MFYFYQLSSNNSIYFSINSILLKPLPLATLLNSWINSFIVLFSCSIFFNSTTFTNSLFPFLNSYFRLARNSPTVRNSRLSFFKSSIIFSFQISADLLYIYNQTHCICSFTVTFLIFILIYNLHAVKNPKILLVSLLDAGSLATSTFDLVLSLETSATVSFSVCPAYTATNTCKATICSCCCFIRGLQTLKSVANSTDKLCTQALSNKHQ